MYCSENNCDLAECHRCFPVPGCDDHEKCRMSTHPAIGQKVIYSHMCNGTATGTVVEIKQGNQWPDVRFQVDDKSPLAEYITLSASWLNWDGDPWDASKS